MSNLSLRLPESLHKQVKMLAKQEGVSINQFVTTVLAEKLSALMTQDYLQAKAAGGNRDAFEQGLANVPDTLPEDHDRL